MKNKKKKSQVKTSFEAPEIGSLIENLHEVVNGLEKGEKKEKSKYPR